MTPDHILMKADEAMLRALANINASNEGKKLKELIGRLINQCDLNNRTFTGEPLYRSQGAVQMLQALLDSLEQARQRQK